MNAKQCPLCGVWVYGYETTNGFQPAPHNCHWNKTIDNFKTNDELTIDSSEDELDNIKAERDKLYEALNKVIPVLEERLGHLRAKNDKRALQLTNDLADIKELQKGGNR